MMATEFQIVLIYSDFFFVSFHENAEQILNRQAKQLHTGKGTVKAQNQSLFKV